FALASSLPFFPFLTFVEFCCSIFGFLSSDFLAFAFLSGPAFIVLLVGISSLYEASFSILVSSTFVGIVAFSATEVDLAVVGLATDLFAGFTGSDLTALLL